MPTTVERCGVGFDLLHRVVQEHLDDFLAQAQDEGRHLPPWMERTFRDYLDCGRSHNVAHDHDLCRGVLGVFLEVVFAWYRARLGLPHGQPGAITVIQRFSSALAIDPHFHSIVLDGLFARHEASGELRFHPLPAIDTADVEHVVAYAAVRIERFLARRGFGRDEDDRRRGGDDEAATDDGQLMLQVHSLTAPVQREAGGLPAPVRRHQVIAGRRRELPPLCAICDGYNLHAGVHLAAHARAALERLCRYTLRGPLPKGRAFHALLRAKHLGGCRPSLEGASSGGAPRRQAAVAPEETMVGWQHGLDLRAPRVARQAGRAPAPAGQERHLLPRGAGRESRLPSDVGDPRYFAPSTSVAVGHRWRALEVVPTPPQTVSLGALGKDGGAGPRFRIVGEGTARHRPWRLPWVDLLWRTFSANSMACPHCGKRMTVRALVLPSDVGDPRYFAPSTSVAVGHRRRALAVRTRPTGRARRRQLTQANLATTV